MKSNGLIVYNGPSLYDGKGIIAILTRDSNNSKTGSMVQLWILREDTAPIEASRIGADVSICGKCPHMGKANPDKPAGWADGRTCYVNLLFAPSAIYKTYKKGGYTEARTIDQVKGFIGGNNTRLGAYGDPAALPAGLIDLLAELSGGVTGYTHGQGMIDSVDYKHLMQSVESKREALKAHNIGVRTFRVIPLKLWAETGRGGLLPNEIVCPATQEGGYRAECNSCMLCGGSKIRGKNIAVVAHGASKGKIV